VRGDPCRTRHDEMKIIVNGAERETSVGSSVAGVVATVTGQMGGVAVALNDEVVPRADWKTTIVREADRIEVLTAVQGG
jgi:sulfur carrier protein